MPSSSLASGSVDDDVSSANAVTADRGSMVIIMQTATNKLIKRLGLIIFYSFSMIFPKTLYFSQNKRAPHRPNGWYNALNPCRPAARSLS